MNYVFPLLRKEDIEVRVGQETKDKTSFTVMFYKTARTDMKYLDEIVGSDNWQKEYYECNGYLFCRIGIWNEEKKQWIWKSDAGDETTIEKVKGNASDAMKRACFNVGIGRELYSASDLGAIWMKRTDVNEKTMRLEEITYNEQERTIKSVKISACPSGSYKESERFICASRSVADTKAKPIEKPQPKSNIIKTEDINVADTFNTDDGITDAQKKIIQSWINAHEEKLAGMQTFMKKMFGVEDYNLLKQKDAEQFITLILKVRKE